MSNTLSTEEMLARLTGRISLMYSSSSPVPKYENNVTQTRLNMILQRGNNEGDCDITVIDNDKSIYYVGQNNSTWIVV